MSGEKLRATKVGIGYVVEQKQEQNYDREEEAGVVNNIIDWLNQVTAGDHAAIGDREWKGFNAHIKDGVMLCKAVNKLLASAGKPAISFQKKVMSPFVAMTNVENFNAGCMAYGLDKESTFQTGDLCECRKAGMYNVVNCVHSLGQLANSKGFTPSYSVK